MKLTTILLLVGTAVSTSAHAQQATNRVVLTLPDGRDFTIPVSPVGARNQPVAMIPFNKGSLVGLRIVPRIVEGRVSVEVSAMLGDPDSTPSTLTCAEVKNWSRQEIVGSYLLAENDSLALSDLAKYTLPPLQLSLTNAQRVSCPTSCCCVGNLKCCPDEGQCLQCDSAGLCCM
jgi:hypothetical protein